MKEWADAKAIIGAHRVLLGRQASQQWLQQPDHLAMVLARYRAASAFIGDSQSVVEFGCGEGIGAVILGRGRTRYVGLDADIEALNVARSLNGGTGREFVTVDLGDGSAAVDGPFDAAVSLDVIEHIPTEDETRFMWAAVRLLSRDGILVIGTPSACAEHLASPQSKAGHINLYTPERLNALMRRYFRRVLDFGMQDTSLHSGHSSMRHYLFAVGIGPR